MFGKIKRIFLKSLAVIFITLMLLLTGLYIGIQSYTFQTWLGNGLSTYISKELNAKVSIDAIQLDLFKKAKLKGVTILDRNQDTIFYGNLSLDVKNFNYKQQSLKLKKITLENTTSKLIYYKHSKDLNIQFLVDYFSPSTVPTKKIKKKGWDVSFGDIVLQNISFVYRDEDYDTSVSKNINFDNICVKNTSGTLSNLKFNDEIIEVKIKNLKSKEQSGFELSNLSAYAKVSSKELFLDNLYLKTSQSCLIGNLRFNSHRWRDYYDFENKIKMDANFFDSSKVCFADVARFTSDLNGLNQTVNVSGNVSGFVSYLRLKNFKLNYGNYTKFDGDLTIRGLPYFRNTYLNFNAKEISTNYYDLIKIPNYPFTENKILNLPSQLKPLGTVTYKGNFDGFLNDFTALATLNTAIGKVNVDVAIKLGEKFDKLEYVGKIKTEGFSLGAITGVSNLSNLTVNTEINGKGTSLKTLSAVFNGQVITCNYNGYVYNTIKLSGDFKNQVFNGQIVSTDPNANFDFNGKINFKNKVPEMDFISTINTLNLSVLNLAPRSMADSGVFSSQILINLKGDNLDNLTGLINFDDTKYKTKTKNYKLSMLNIDIDQAKDYKNIKLSSAYLNASIEGYYQLNNIQQAFEEFVYNYYPTFLNKQIVVKKYDSKITFKANIKNFKTISELFIPDVLISNGTTLNGNIDIAQKSFDIDILSKQIKYKGISFDNLKINSHEENNLITANLSGSDLKLTDSIVLKNFNLNISTHDKNTNYNFEWNNLLKPANKGQIAGNVTFNNSNIIIQQDTVTLTQNDSTWNLITSNPTVIDSGGIVTLNPLLFTNHNQKIGLAGVISNNQNQSLVVNTSNVILEQFNPLLKSSGVFLEGILSGSIAANSILKNPVFSSNLNIIKLKVNNNYLGELVLKTEYNSNDKYIYLDGFTSIGLRDQFNNLQKNISFNGYYYLDKRDEAFDIDFICAPANLKLLNPYLVDILTIKNGLVKGKGKVHGSPSNIKIEGKLNLFKSEIKVDYTNVTYNVTGDIEIMPDQIRFSEMLMSVTTQTTKFASLNSLNAIPQATLNGNLFHTNFNKMQLDYDISYKDMLVLNTTEKENKDFYGKIYCTGNMGIYGFLNNLHMEVRATTNKNSKLILPLDGPSEVGENDFIHFVVKKDTVKKEEQSTSGFNLDMLINATPDAITKIILDNKTGDGLNLQGNGDIAMKINTLGKFEIVGDYHITNGDYIFTLENVINKKFDIDEGSLISWSGNPLGADLNITTSYKQRASIGILMNDTTDDYKARVPVNCKLIITDKLFSPKINFKIDVPTVEPNAKARIANVLSDEAELNRQVFSFLLFRTFVTPAIYNSTTGGVTYGSAAASTGSELLSNRLSGFLNSYVGNLTGLKDLNLGLNYRTGNQNTGGQAIDLALSKQFLNNKISIDGNFGVNNNQVGNNSSSLIGDVNVEYKLSDDGRFRVKGFNRTNSNTQVATTGGPFTQGVGIFYRLEFERMFKRQMEEDKKKKKPNP